MRFDPGIHDYLTGARFSSGLRVRIAAEEAAVPDRISLLEGLVRGKAIIHLGCTDHIPLIEDKIKHGTWLHARLCGSARRCLGVDTNGEGIELLRSRFGVRDVVCGDILSDVMPEIETARWDYIVAGEVLEHVDNPVAFLTGVRNRYSGTVARMVITVPNAFGWANLRNALRNNEYINTDHRYWFTPYTLGKIATRAGMEIHGFHLCESVPAPATPGSRLGIRARAMRCILARRPLLRQHVLMEVKL